jgi:hypothetical protein
MKKLGLKNYRGMEFDAAGVERISGCLVSVTVEKDAWRLRMLRCWRIFS